METIFNYHSDSYLTTILDIPTPSGFEQQGQAFVQQAFKPYADEVTTDAIGNVIAYKKGKCDRKLMISAHIDEIGFMVKYIDDAGMLYVTPTGGIDLLLLPGLRLAVHHGNNTFTGVIGRKPIHLLNDSERKSFTYEDLWLDLGFTSKKHALLSVAVGDRVTFSTNMLKISDEYIIGHSFDDKIGSLIMYELLRKLEGVTPECSVYFVSSVQEELGLRGAMPAAYRIKPDLSIAIDATHATDYPSANLKLHGDVRLGGGATLSISPDTDSAFAEELRRTAEANSIPHQLEAHSNVSGTEAKAIQVVAQGAKTAIVSFPVRYMHSPSEMVDIKDVTAIVDLLFNFCTKP